MPPLQLSFPAPNRPPSTVLVQCFSGVTSSCRSELRAPNAAYLNADSIVSLSHLLFGLSKALVLSKVNRPAPAEAPAATRGPSSFERELCVSLGGTSHGEKAHQEVSFDWSSSSSSSSSSSKLVLVVVEKSEEGGGDDAAAATQQHYASFESIEAELLASGGAAAFEGSPDDFLKDVDKQKKERLVAVFKVHAAELGDGKGGAYDWRDLESAVITRMATKDLVKL